MAMDEAQEHEEEPVIKVLPVLLDEETEGIQELAVYLQMIYTGI